MRAGRLALAAFAAAAIFFGLGIGGRELWHVDENRYAEVARVMTLPGADPVVPHLNGELYAHKPPAFFWGTAFGHGVLGFDLPLAAKLVSLLGGALAVGSAAAVAAILYGRTAGLATAVTLATMLTFGSLARRAQLDALLTGFTTLAVAAFAAGRFRAGVGAAGRTLAYTGACLAAGLGVLVKGPVALMVPGSAIAAGVLLDRGARALRSPWWVAAPLLGLLPVALWLAAAADHAGIGYARAIALGHGVGHAMGQVDKVRPPWFYLGVLPVGALPWTLLLPAGFLALRRFARPEERAADRFALAWAIVPFVLFCAVPAKRNLYLDPVYPGLALVVGRLARDLVDAPEGAARFAQRWVSLGVRALGAIFALGGALVVVASAAIALAPDAIARASPAFATMRPEATPALLLRGLALGALAFGGGFVALRALAPGAAARGLAVGAVAAGLVYGWVASPLADPALGARDFARRIAPVVGDAPIADYGGGADFLLNWALPREVVPIVQERADADAFVAAHPEGPLFLVVDRPDLDALGTPAGLEIWLEWPRPLDKDLLLLGRGAPPADFRR